MNPIIQELLEKGFTLQMSYNPATKRIGYSLGGFYKSGTVLLEERIGYDGHSLMATARYNGLTIINDFDDLVRLNYDWWRSSKGRYEGWANPDDQWLPFLIKRNYVDKAVKTIYTEKNDDNNY